MMLQMRRLTKLFSDNMIYKCIRRNLSCATTQDQNIVDLCAHFNISEERAKYLTLKYPTIKKLSNVHIENLINTVYNIGFHKEVLLDEPVMFSILPITLAYRYQVLKECGIQNITSKHIVTYLNMVRKKTVGDLKSEGLLLHNFNVENQLASFFTQWPTSLTNTILGDSDMKTLYSLRINIIQRYMELVLDMTEDEFRRGLITYPTLKHRPLGAIRDTLNILQTDLMMPVNKIKSNFYLVHADPQNLKQMIYTVKSISNFDIREIMRMFPKIAMKNYRTVLEIKKIMKDYEISDESQRRCFEIYTLGPDTIKERLERAKKLPEFQVLYQHPRFLKMIYFNNTAMARLKKLQEVNKKCLSLHILCGGSSKYQNFEKAPGDRNGKGKDVIFCICNAFGKEYSAPSIRTLIKRHPFWINVPVIQIKYVFQKLSLNFSKKDIYENCTILLYPWIKIKPVIKLVTEETLSTKVITEPLDITKLSKSQKLSLILYLLEKEHYFSGNGIWTEDQMKNVSEIITARQSMQI